MISFKQFLLEISINNQNQQTSPSEEVFVPGVFGDGKNNYSVNRLVQLTKERTPIKIPVLDLVQQNQDVVTSEGNFGSNLLNPSKKFAARVERANTEFPILVDETGWIIDGSHRLAKLHMNGETYANVHIISDDDLQNAVITSDEELKRSKSIPQ
jgi:hypothetical protein